MIPYSSNINLLLHMDKFSCIGLFCLISFRWVGNQKKYEWKFAGSDMNIAVVAKFRNIEYIEPGATATDDRRIVFQKMIAEACMQPAPFETIIVHSLSRFFRDAPEFGLYERQEVMMSGRHADVVNAMQKAAQGCPIGLPRTGSVWGALPDS